MRPSCSMCRDASGFTAVADFAVAREILRRHTLTLVGVQNALPAQIEAAAGADLASFAPNSTHPRRPRAAAAPSPRRGGTPAARATAAGAAGRSGKDPARDAAGAIGHADLRPRRRSDRDRRGQPGCGADRRRQHPRVRACCAGGRSPGRPAMSRRESFAAGSRPNSSRSPAAISSATRCRPRSGVYRCRSRLSMTG